MDAHLEITPTANKRRMRHITKAFRSRRPLGSFLRVPMRGNKSGNMMCGVSPTQRIIWHIGHAHFFYFLYDGGTPQEEAAHRNIESSLNPKLSHGKVSQKLEKLLNLLFEFMALQKDTRASGERSARRALEVISSRLLS